MAQFLQETIDEHRRTFDPSHLRDVLDTYLYQIQKANEEGTSHHLFGGRDHGKTLNIFFPLDNFYTKSIVLPDNSVLIINTYITTLRHYLYYFVLVVIISKASFNLQTIHKLFRLQFYSVSIIRSEKAVKSLNFFLI